MSAPWPEASEDERARGWPRGYRHPPSTVPRDGDLIDSKWSSSQGPDGPDGSRKTQRSLLGRPTRTRQTRTTGGRATEMNIRPRFWAISSTISILSGSGKVGKSGGSVEGGQGKHEVEWPTQAHSRLLQGTTDLLPLPPGISFFSSFLFWPPYLAGPVQYPSHLFHPATHHPTPGGYHTDTFLALVVYPFSYATLFPTLISRLFPAGEV